MSMSHQCQTKRLGPKRKKTLFAQQHRRRGSIFVGNQCDHIKLFLKFLRHNLCYKRCPKIWLLFGYFNKHYYLRKNWILGNVSKNWATVYTYIWSHCNGNASQLVSLPPHIPLIEHGGGILLFRYCMIWVLTSPFWILNSRDENRSHLSLAKRRVEKLSRLPTAL